MPISEASGRREPKDWIGRGVTIGPRPNGRRQGRAMGLRGGSFRQGVRPLNRPAWSATIGQFGAAGIVDWTRNALDAAGQPSSPSFNHHAPFLTVAGDPTPNKDAEPAMQRQIAEEVLLNPDHPAYLWMRGSVGERRDGGRV